MPIIRKMSLFGAFATVFSAFCYPGIAHALELQAHQAGYQLSLVSKKSNAQIVGLSGLLTLRLERVCEGWILAQKMSQRMDVPTVGVIESISNSAVLELANGRDYRFNTRQKNGATVLDIQGSVAVDNEGKVVAQYKKPTSMTKVLSPETVFPIEHTKQLIAAALEGKKQVEHKVFDGFDGASGHFVTTLITPLGQPNVKNSRNLLAGRRWRMELAYFPLEGTMAAPVLEMSALILESGIAEQITYNYERFGIRADLKKIEVVSPPVCK